MFSTDFSSTVLPPAVFDPSLDLPITSMLGSDQSIKHDRSTDKMPIIESYFDYMKDLQDYTTPVLIRVATRSLELVETMCFGRIQAPTIAYPQVAPSPFAAFAYEP